MDSTKKHFGSLIVAVSAHRIYFKDCACSFVTHTEFVVIQKIQLRKLALYSRGRPTVGLDDVLAVVADASSMTLDAVVDAAFAGKAQDLEISLGKAQSTGVAPSLLVSATTRQAAALHRLRLAVEEGRSAGEVVESAGPAIHFSRKVMVQAALSAWTSKRLERLIGHLGDVALEVRQRPALAYPIAHRALLSIVGTARRKE